MGVSPSSLFQTFTYFFLFLVLKIFLFKDNTYLFLYVVNPNHIITHTQNLPSIYCKPMSRSNSAISLGAEFQFQQDTCRSITVNISMLSPVHEKVPEVQHYLDSHGLKYVIGKEHCRSGQEHLEIAIWNGVVSANIKRDFSRMFQEYNPHGSYWYHNRLHKGVNALIKLGYSLKEGNYVTNLDAELLAKATEAYETKKEVPDVIDPLFKLKWRVVDDLNDYNLQLFGYFAEGVIDRGTYLRFLTPNGRMTIDLIAKRHRDSNTHYYAPSL